jgi:hypothetical protein
VKRPTKVRSTFGAPVEMPLNWVYGETQFSYFILDGSRYQMGPRGTGHVRPENSPKGHTLDYVDLRDALEWMGWEIIG